MSARSQTITRAVKSIGAQGVYEAHNIRNQTRLGAPRFAPRRLEARRLRAGEQLSGLRPKSAHRRSVPLLAMRLNVFDQRDRSIDPPY
jgi:hypothetical protein